MKLILKKHRNSLLELIRAAKLDPQSFSPSEEATETGESFRLEVRDSPYYFTLNARFRDESREFWGEAVTFVINYPNPLIGEIKSLNWGSFDKALWLQEPITQMFGDWLSSIKKYFNYLAEEEQEQMLPDLWSELSLPPSSSPSLLNLQNTPFSKEEQIRISESLRDYLEEVKKRGILTTEQLNLLQEQTEDLVKSSKRLGRKDWLQAAVGALIGVTLSAGLTSPIAVEVIQLAGEALQWIARTPLLLPQYRGF